MIESEIRLECLRMAQVAVAKNSAGQTWRSLDEIQADQNTILSLAQIYWTFCYQGYDSGAVVVRNMQRGVPVQ